MLKSLITSKEHRYVSNPLYNNINIKSPVLKCQIVRGNSYQTNDWIHDRVLYFGLTVFT